MICQLLFDIVFQVCYKDVIVFVNWLNVFVVYNRRCFWVFVIFEVGGGVENGSIVWYKVGVGCLAFVCVEYRWVFVGKVSEGYVEDLIVGGVLCFIGSLKDKFGVVEVKISFSIIVVKGELVEVFQVGFLFIVQGVSSWSIGVFLSGLISGFCIVVVGGKQ